MRSEMFSVSWVLGSGSGARLAGVTDTPCPLRFARDNDSVGPSQAEALATFQS